MVVPRTYFLLLLLFVVVKPGVLVPVRVPLPPFAPEVLVLSWPHWVGGQELGKCLPPLPHNPPVF